MPNISEQYPKFLAFLKLFYPSLYEQIRIRSENTDLVEASLICSNNTHKYQAIIFSEGSAKDGELFDIYADIDSIAPYSWDWRWVFAVKILFKRKLFFSMRFKQKVIALPTGKHPLTNIFFDILQDEFKSIVFGLEQSAASKNMSIHECYTEYCKSIKN